MSVEKGPGRSAAPPSPLTTASTPSASSTSSVSYSGSVLKYEKDSRTYGMPAGCTTQVQLDSGAYCGGEEAGTGCSTRLPAGREARMEQG